jgi:peptidoglycan/LPS O-acetylase OafA/YrhL
VFREGDSFFHYTAPTLKQVATHLLLVQNFFSGSFILYPMWSLPIEVQMYLLLPVLFFFLRKNMTLWPLLLMWALAAATAHQAFGPQEVNLAVSIPYFLPGLMAYVGFSRWKPVLPGWSFVLVLAAIVWLGGHAGDWQRAWWPCLALGLVLPGFRQMGQNFFTKLCWQIARYSYGIYLTHPFALVLAFYVCHGYSRPVQFTVLFGSLAVFAFAAFHLIEAPFMRAGAKLAGRVAVGTAV